MIILILSQNGPLIMSIYKDANMIVLFLCAIHVDDFKFDF